MDDDALKKLNPIVVMLLGIITFLIGALIGNVVILYMDQYLIALPLAGVIGGILLGLILRLKNKIWKMGLSGLLGLPLGLAASFMIVEGIGSLIPSIGKSMENTIIPDIIVLIIMGIVLGFIAGIILYGLKASGLFVVVCGLGGIPGGIAVGFMNTSMEFKTQIANMAEPFSKLDYNLMAMSATLGLGFGLAMALYNNRIAGSKQ